MPETDEITAYVEWHRSLPEPDAAAYLDLIVTEGHSLAYWLDWISSDQTVEEFSNRLRTFQKFFEKRGPLRREFRSAYIHGQLGLVMKYLEKFDDETPAEEVPKQLMEDVYRWRHERDEFSEEG